MVELDVRTLARAQKHRTIRLRLEQLDTGNTLQLINDHDPRPLRHELEDAYPGHFTWTYVESGPRTWRVDIQKTEGFEPHEDIELLADSLTLRVGQIRVPAGVTTGVMNFTGSAVLIFDEGTGVLEISSRPRPVAAGTLEIICPTETCTISASTALHAYVAIAKE
jgi:uncharacterized protein (DUF2249 family)